MLFILIAYDKAQILLNTWMNGKWILYLNISYTILTTEILKSKIKIKNKELF